MPTYQYRCATCDHRFEAVQSFSDASLTTCPACSGALRKVFTAVGIVFKGSGFYRTDSRSGAGSTVAGGDASAKNGSDKVAASKNGSGSETNGSGSAKSGKDTASASSSSSSSSTPAAAAS